jgi:hypothetical protein
MADTTNKAEREPAPAETPQAAESDPRRPYEAPKLLKKRSVARATLFTAVGPMGTLTSMG